MNVLGIAAARVICWHTHCLADAVGIRRKEETDPAVVITYVALPYSQLEGHTGRRYLWMYLTFVVLTNTFSGSFCQIGQNVYC
jgi:hypothetical protein